MTSQITRPTVLRCSRFLLIAFGVFKAWATRSLATAADAPATGPRNVHASGTNAVAPPASVSEATSFHRRHHLRSYATASSTASETSITTTDAMITRGTCSSDATRRWACELDANGRTRLSTECRLHRRWACEYHRGATSRHHARCSLAARRPAEAR